MISDELKQKLKEKGQFPYGKRDRAYQSIDGQPGIRDMNHRYDIIQFPKSFDGETVIDFGCSAGAICLDAKKRGAKRVVGLDYKDETIQVAKSLAKEMGFKGMQFNLVVSNNKWAIKLWESEGFKIVGQIPSAFNHPNDGLIDAFIMFKKLS